MSRKLASWAIANKSRPKRKLTWIGDMLGFAPSLFGLRHRRPAGAPPRAASRDRLAASDILVGPDWLNLLSLRLKYRVSGLDGLEGLQGPLIFAANESGPLDWQVLRAVLPFRLRTTNHRLSRALAAGRGAVIFAEEPVIAGQVGEFTTVAAELANQHNVPIVPVALVGTFKLNEVLGLSLATKPLISVRFGAPIYGRGRSVLDTTAELQAAVGELFRSAEPSWWAMQRRTKLPTGAAGAPMSRWRRLWQQSEPISTTNQTKIWR